MEEIENRNGIIIKHGNGTNLYFLDQLNKKEEIWVHNQNIKKYLLDTYNLTEEQYFLKVTKTKPKRCPICNERIPFISLAKQYRNTTCSSSCHTKFENQRRITNGTHNFLGGQQKKDWWKKEKENGGHKWSKTWLEKNRKHLNEMERNTKAFHSFESNCKVARRYAIKSSVKYLYVAEYEDKSLRYKWIKFGVTKDIDNRKFGGHQKLINFIEILYSENSELIADIEYILKLKYANRNVFNRTKETERYYKSDKQKIIRYARKLFNNSSTTIESVSNELEKNE